MRVIPGLVSIPEVKSFCVLFVYYGFSMGISFRCKPSHIYNYQFFFLLFCFYYYFTCYCLFFTFILHRYRRYS